MPYGNSSHSSAFVSTKISVPVESPNNILPGAFVTLPPVWHPISSWIHIFERSYWPLNPWRSTKLDKCAWRVTLISDGTFCKMPSFPQLSLPGSRGGTFCKCQACFKSKNPEPYVSVNIGLGYPVVHCRTTHLFAKVMINHIGFTNCTSPSMNQS